ncbi:CAP domain-containing protein [Aquibacillus koreensis]|uniref:CAP domain-containing protein n=1 Tax=Aquibacillus koreensis TaxID=279446 RepID=A0A9X3WJ68_9BACI|nr:CAP domain-containing protein [Aquibacillus koreensis]MCT2535158.1 CAP domain-containing protein [Aquibacillus koreensis]MDC3421017.1 CAP domain-containing protein [Aquibacillus koreensis]
MLKKYVGIAMFTLILFLGACNTNEQETGMDDWRQDIETPRQVNFETGQSYWTDKSEKRNEQPAENEDEKRYSGLEYNANTDNTNDKAHQPNHNQFKKRVPNQQANETQNGKQMNQANQNTDNNQNTTDMSDFQMQVVELTNQKRQENGLPPLSADQELTEVAQVKAKDMADNNYFSHTSPTYGSPFDMMNQFGIDYTSASENIAAGQTTPEEVVRGWMNSEGHRKNILSNKSTHIGVGFYENGNQWVQMFIQK